MKYKIFIIFLFIGLLQPAISKTEVVNSDPFLSDVLGVKPPPVFRNAFDTRIEMPFFVEAGAELIFSKTAGDFNSGSSFHASLGYNFSGNSSVLLQFNIDLLGSGESGVITDSNVPTTSYYFDYYEKDNNSYFGILNFRNFVNESNFYTIIGMSYGMGISELKNYRNPFTLEYEKLSISGTDYSVNLNIGLGFKIILDSKIFDILNFLDGLSFSVSTYYAIPIYMYHTGEKLYSTKVQPLNGLMIEASLGYNI